MITKHASERFQQRGIPPLIKDLLMLYGDHKYTGHDAVIRYFSKNSRKKMSKDLGKVAVNQLSRFFSIYLIHSVSGEVITVARRTRRIKDK